jgi:hypothetical protein
MLNATKLGGIGAVLLGLAAGAADAQVSTASISGVVRDATGAVLPGVTIEAASPALIERVRTAVTDDAGQYRIIELRPGTYTVTFTLEGFNTSRQEGLELTAGFTATVNGDLKVGSIAETVTVTGQTPVVDVQNTRATTVMSRPLLDALPTGGEFQDIVVLIPGVIGNRGSDRNVGGQLGQTFGAMGVHGGSPRDQMFLLDGHTMDSGQTRGASNFQFSEGNYEEFVMDVAGQTAETPFGGIRINMVPREGSNQFRGTFMSNFTNTSLAANNITDELRRQGLGDPNNVKTLWRVTPTFGGPVARDRVWFYLTYTHQVADNYVAGSYYNQANAYPRFIPDLSRRGVDTFKSDDATGRVTWQATPRNKLTGYFDYNNNCHCMWILVGTGNAYYAPDGAPDMRSVSKVFQGSWSSPVTNRLLFQASIMEHPQLTNLGPQPGQENVISSVDIAIPKAYGSSGGYQTWDQYKRSIRGSMSYVTGSHSVKVGGDYHRHRNDRPYTRPVDYEKWFANGFPVFVNYFPTPYVDHGLLSPELGLFAQDQWTLKRVSVNAGVRFDYIHQGWPDTPLPPTINIPIAREFTAQTYANFKDISPRIGVAYDLFGNGKTAIKGFANRYVGLGASSLNRIQGALVALGTDRRSWTDRNGDGEVQGDPINPAANGEIGPRTNGNFTNAVYPRRFDPDYINGWGTRPATNWEFSGSIQQQLRQGMSVNVGYFHRIFRTFEVLENAAVTPADYDPFCVTTPSNARLPGGGGQQLCGFYDLKPNKVGLTDNVIHGDSTFGGQHETFRGFDVTLDARFSSRLILQGGISTGKATSDVCAFNNYPNVTWASTLTFGELGAGQNGAYDRGTTTDRLLSTVSTTMCKLETPFLTQGKFFGTYTLPWDIRLSGTLSNVPGPVINADAIFTSAQVAQSLGRPLSSASTVTVNLVRPQSLYGERRTEVDLRVARSLRLGTRRIEGMVDFYNIFNSSAVTRINSVYGLDGALWQQPLGILSARLVKFGVQVNF